MYGLKADAIVGYVGRAPETMRGKTMRLRNRFTGETLEAVQTPLNGAWIIKQGTVELHRGNATTARAYLENMLERVGYIWERAS